MSLALLPNDEYVLSASSDGSVHVWDLMGGRSLGSVQCAGQVAALATSVVCTVLAVGNELQLWDVSSRRLLAGFTGETPFISCAAYGNVIVAGDEGGRLYVFDATVG